LKNKEMKKKVFLLLFLAGSSLLSSQHNNKRLHEIFDSNAFEISIPNTWVAQEVFYPFRWVKQLALKDTLSKGYFTVGQFEIKYPKRFKLKNIVKTRLSNLYEGRYRKFTHTINKKESSFDDHYVLNTSWRNWRDKKSILKHTTEYLQKDNIVYVFRYSDSTYSSPSFKNDVEKMIASFKVKRNAKELYNKNDIPKDQLRKLMNGYFLEIPKTWYSYMESHGVLYHSPKEIKKNGEIYYSNKVSVFKKETDEAIDVVLGRYLAKSKKTAKFYM